MSSLHQKHKESLFHYIILATLNFPLSHAHARSPHASASLAHSPARHPSSPLIHSFRDADFLSYSANGVLHGFGGNFATTQEFPA